MTPCRNYPIPLNSAHRAVAIQHLQVMTVCALIAMDSPFSVIVLQMTIQAYLAMNGLIPQVACQIQWAITSLLIAMTVQNLVAMRCLKRYSVNRQLMLSLSSFAHSQQVPRWQELQMGFPCGPNSPFISIWFVNSKCSQLYIAHVVSCKIV